MLLVLLLAKELVWLNGNSTTSDGRIALNNGTQRMASQYATVPHILTSFALAYCRVTMVCLLIAHGIFLPQEASQSSRGIMKSPRPATTHLV